VTPIRLRRAGTWVQVRNIAGSALEPVCGRSWTDIDLPARFSDEFLGATWNGEDLAKGCPSWVGIVIRHRGVGGRVVR